ncbi:MAG: SMC-Scp complex subunit ScpB [Anaerovoracaceae bacterium]|nr:SMC-Scp complex subunit ScpB [Bacillota bacterium]MEE0516810.1 SMC-Scp complex subunit ScpB [Anaerovoracaceae bacterium]
MGSKKTIKSAFESMLFTWGEPLPAKAAADVFNISKQEAIEYFTELQEEYEQEGRGIVIRRVNQSFQFVTREENADYIRSLCTPIKTKKLSQSALEVLAIVAYKQPVTKGEIEAIRGIRCDRVMEGLIKKDLVCEKGRADTVGRPILYSTTDTFLRNFGFSSIKDLPQIDDIESVSEDAEADAEVADDGQIKIEI